MQWPHTLARPIESRPQASRRCSSNPARALTQSYMKNLLSDEPAIHNTRPQFVARDIRHGLRSRPGTRKQNKIGMGLPSTTRRYRSCVAMASSEPCLKYEASKILSGSACKSRGSMERLVQTQWPARPQLNAAGSTTCYSRATAITHSSGKLVHQRASLPQVGTSSWPTVLLAQPAVGISVARVGPDHVLIAVNYSRLHAEHVVPLATRFPQIPTPPFDTMFHAITGCTVSSPDPSRSY
ncbi:hypothetical protein B0H67DRAFT_176595 [Lasiosphaeris hirsuta]|uniref:Uncharacterized protein n=1 Tax=Lasiosphaeris hirsuta TaxID=260670 RepID=A0AA40AQF1_9PEZI|nr:hypothetical protein B0H67DRAFT_176595 [Lasiosphaeris hirsuta]